MIINRNFKDFKFRHRSNKNQIIYTSKKVKNDDEVINLIDNFLIEKNSFIFESVEKGKIKGRYTIFGKNPDKIWEFNNKNSYLIKGKKKFKLKDKPDQLIEKIIEEFKFETPKKLPKICSLISGYFSYDSIRYVEKIPNNCKNDLNLPAGRFRSFLQLFGIFSTYLIESYEKYPDIKEHIFGSFFGVSNLNSSIIFSINWSGLSFNLNFFLPLIKYEFLLLNSQILSGFLPKIVYLPLILPFSTDSKIKLFFSIKKLSIRFMTSSSFFTFLDV